MAIRKCQNCGAPLPDGPPENPITCTYCRVVNRPHATVVERFVMVVRGPEDASSGRRLAGIITVVVVLGIFATIGIVLWRALAPWSSSTTIGPPPTPRVTVTKIQAAPGSMLVIGGGTSDPFGGTIRAPGGATVTTAEQYGDGKPARDDLASGVGSIFTGVEAAGLTASWPRFEPLAALPWMTETARAWSGDARLVGLRVRGVRDDGTADCAGSSSGSVEYTFASASRGAPSSPASGLTLRAAAGKVEARTERPPGSPPEAAAPAASCGIAPVVTALRDLGLPAAEAYQLSLAPAAEGTWRWTATAPGKGRLEVAAAIACP
jgi:hypothetical protein